MSILTGIPKQETPLSSPLSLQDRQTTVDGPPRHKLHTTVNLEEIIKHCFTSATIARVQHWTNINVIQKIHV